MRAKLLAAVFVVGVLVCCAVRATPPGFRLVWRIDQCPHCRAAGHTFQMTPAIYSQIDWPTYQPPTSSRLRSLTTCVNPQDNPTLGRCRLQWSMVAD